MLDAAAAWRQRPHRRRKPVFASQGLDARRGADLYEPLRGRAKMVWRGARRDLERRMSSRRRKGPGRKPARGGGANPPVRQPADTPAGAWDDLLQRATTHRMAGRFTEAEPLYEQLLKADPGDLRPLYFLALIDLKVTRHHRALDRLRIVTAAAPRSFDAWEAAAYAHQALGQWPEAVDACLRALQAAPGNAKMRFSLATALTIMGRLPEAVAEYRKITGDKADQLGALVRIAELEPATITPEDLAAMTEGAQDVDIDAEVRVQLRFALGELLERLGRYDDAFDALEAGNRQKRASLGSPPAASDAAIIRQSARALSADLVVKAHTESTAFFTRTFTPEFIAQHQGGGHPFAAPIFIVGLPRCGSTLLEQILASHSAIRGMGEAGSLGHFSRDHFPLNPGATKTPEHFRRLADRYISNMVSLGWDGRLRILDKTLNNFHVVGLIHLMFPRAVILHSVRDPVDTCLGCYRKLFRTSNEWTYDLRDIGQVYVEYRQMMDHWAKVLPGRIVDVSYEALVADPDAQIRQLVTATCGLEWEDACLNFHESPNPVRSSRPHSNAGGATRDVWGLCSTPWVPTPRPTCAGRPRRRGLETGAGLGEKGWSGW
jgi:tetratricopeptide (TPR) repeat protein